MKQKISVTLSSDVLGQIDRLAAPASSRSSVIEDVLRAYFRELNKKKLNARDLKRINAAARRLNAEMADVLEYQSSG